MLVCMTQGTYGPNLTMKICEMRRAGLLTKFGLEGVFVGNHVVFALFVIPYAAVSEVSEDRIKRGRKFVREGGKRLK